MLKIFLTFTSQLQIKNSSGPLSHHYYLQKSNKTLLYLNCLWGYVHDPEGALSIL